MKLYQPTYFGVLIICAITLSSCQSRTTVAENVDLNQVVATLDTIDIPTQITLDSVFFSSYRDSVYRTKAFEQYATTMKLDPLISTNVTTIGLSDAKINYAMFDFLRKKKPDPVTAPPIPVVPLPNSYVSRTFLTNDIGYDIFQLPGNLIKKSADGKFEIKTLVALIKNNKTPLNETIADGLVYEEKVSKEASFNGSAIIGSLTVGANEMMELVIQDVTKSSVPDPLIDVAGVAAWAKRIPAAERTNWYYVKLVTLTLISNKKYTEASLTAAVNTSFITANGKAYSSNSRFAKDRIVSMRLVSLSDIVPNP